MRPRRIQSKAVSPPNNSAFLRMAWAIRSGRKTVRRRRSAASAVVELGQPLGGDLVGASLPAPHRFAGEAQQPPHLIEAQVEQSHQAPHDLPASLLALRGPQNVGHCRVKGRGGSSSELWTGIWVCGWDSSSSSTVPAAAGARAPEGFRGPHPLTYQETRGDRRVVPQEEQDWKGTMHHAVAEQARPAIADADRRVESADALVHRPHNGHDRPEIDQRQRPEALSLLGHHGAGGLHSNVKSVRIRISRPRHHGWIVPHSCQLEKAWPLPGCPRLPFPSDPGGCGS